MNGICQNQSGTADEFADRLTILNLKEKEYNSHLTDSIEALLQKTDEELASPGTGTVREIARRTAREIERIMTGSPDIRREIQEVTDYLREAVYTVKVPSFGFESSVQERINSAFLDSALPVERFNNFYRKISRLLRENSPEIRQEYINELLDLMTVEDIEGKKHLREVPPYREGLERWRLWSMVRGLEGLFRGMEFHRSLLNRIPLAGSSEIKEELEKSVNWYRTLYEAQSMLNEYLPQAVVATLPFFMVSPGEIPAETASGYRNCLYTIENIDPVLFCALMEYDNITRHFWTRSVYGFSSLTYTGRIIFSRALEYFHLDLEKVLGLLIKMQSGGDICLDTEEQSLQREIARARDSNEAVAAYNRTSSYVTEGLSILNSILLQAEGETGTALETERLILRFLNNRASHVLVSGQLSGRWGLEIKIENRKKINNYLTEKLEQLFSRFYAKTVRELEKRAGSVSTALFLPRDSFPDYTVRNLMIKTEFDFTESVDIVYKVFSQQTKPPSITLDGEEWGKLHGQGVVGWNNLAYLTQSPVNSAEYLSGALPETVESQYDETGQLLTDVIFPWIKLGLETEDPVRRNEYVSRGLIQFDRIYRDVMIPALNGIMMPSSSVISGRTRESLEIIRLLASMDLTLYEAVYVLTSIWLGEDSDTGLIPAVSALIKDMSRGIETIREIYEYQSRINLHRLARQGETILSEDKDAITASTGLLNTLNDELDSGNLSWPDYLELRSHWLIRFLGKAEDNAGTERTSILIEELERRGLITASEKLLYTYGEQYAE
ncbi:MAG: hypothetical protein ACLFSE_00675 [Spirochaetia bacterium]